MPNLPFIYIPDSDFRQMAQIVNGLFGKTVCNPTDSFCRFDMSCDKVPRKDISLEIILIGTINDKMWKVNWVSLDLDVDEMYLEGELVDTFYEDYCYLPIFKSDSPKNTNVWLIGEYLLTKYYMVFDQTPYTNYMHPYLRVGFGIANQGDLS